ncbi:MarR family winged helix-turn-helix transcriptional regulator [Planobispora longispora]|uniref:MarR family transcriptional regulator n=1 Tax=Planobispora longispora TaxID=28887 RepID=A0A8J3RR76_9ACTN|nr:MarR family transcriptional regulator [Planobispora longispora]BFE80641.1 MarR family winged helix-turn-helix transcriptional regulator [Planobispora longispora]GIH79285.1 MarR family transcriptional regulator [Planobispora longispora]
MNEGPRRSEMNLGMLCFIPAREMEARVMKAVIAAGFDDITLAQSRVFQRIGSAGTRVTDLAEQARVTKQTATFLIDQLEKAGYVERVPDPRDARARLVRIAARGRAAIEVAMEAEAEVQAEWTRHLGKRDADNLRRILTRLREIADPYR